MQNDPAIDQAAKLDGLMALVGESAEAVSLKRQLAMVAGVPAPVLIRGKAGSGKLDAAQAIYRLGGYRGGFRVVNCASHNPELLEENLFGRAKGAFGPEDKGRAGAFLRAEDGVVFLDEVASLLPSTQMKLIRVLDEQEIIPLGASRPIKVNARLISATGRDLRTMASAGRFREDLFYRLDAVPVTLPRLNRRLADIPTMASHYYRHLHQGQRPQGIHGEALKALESHTWPGNLRELCSALQTAALNASGAEVLACHLPPELRPAPTQGKAAQVARIKDDLASALTESNGNITAAARILGVSRATVSNRMKKFGVTLAATIKPARSE